MNGRRRITMIIVAVLLLMFLTRKATAGTVPSSSNADKLNSLGNGLGDFADGLASLGGDLISSLGGPSSSGSKGGGAGTPTLLGATGTGSGNKPVPLVPATPTYAGQEFVKYQGSPTSPVFQYDPTDDLADYVRRPRVLP